MLSNIAHLLFLTNENVDSSYPKKECPWFLYAAKAQGLLVHPSCLQKMNEIEVNPAWLVVVKLNRKNSKEPIERNRAKLVDTKFLNT